MQPIAERYVKNSISKFDTFANLDIKAFRNGDWISPAIKHFEI